MNLYFRVLIAFIKNVWRPRMDYRSVMVSTHRVWPTDIDLFGHMNNGRYLQVMDVSRLAWMIRIGVAQEMWHQRWGAVMGGAVVRFRRSLKAFETYRVHTRLLSWDERWWFLEHRFVDEDDRTLAVTVARCALRHNQGWVDTERVLRAVSPDAVPPLSPDIVAGWFTSEQAMWRATNTLVRGAS